MGFGNFRAFGAWRLKALGRDQRSRIMLLRLSAGAYSDLLRARLGVTGFRV